MTVLALKIFVLPGQTKIWTDSEIKKKFNLPNTTRLINKIKRERPTRNILTPVLTKTKKSVDSGVKKKFDLLIINSLDKTTKWNISVRKILTSA